MCLAQEKSRDHVTGIPACAICCSFTGRSEIFCIISGKDKIPDENMTEWKSNLSTITEQNEPQQSKINFIEKAFNDLKTEIKELR